MIISLYFFNNNNITIFVSRKIHIINDFKTNIFININIMIFEKIDVLIFQLKIRIDNYDIIILIEMRIKNRAVVYSIYIKKIIIISLYIQFQISIYYINLLNRDFFFEPDQLNFIFYIYFIDFFFVSF